MPGDAAGAAWKGVKMAGKGAYKGADWSARRGRCSAARAPAGCCACCGLPYHHFPHITAHLRTFSGAKVANSALDKAGEHAQAGKLKAEMAAEGEKKIVGAKVRGKRKGVGKATGVRTLAAW